MCGIVAALDGSGADVMAGLRAATHRGPDCSGATQRSGVTLGHTRLAIVDLDQRSDQPFDYGATTVSFNGEIWNWRELRAQLEAIGFPFRTEGDTEVVAAVLEKYGWTGLRLLNGMFAVAWTHGDGRLWLARDRFGEIPLHWTPAGAASEQKILVAAGMGRSACYVDPGGLVRLEAGKLPETRLWHANGQPEPSALTFLEAAAAVRAGLVRGVTERTMSDVPVCTLLSGGIDSSAIAWAAKQTMPGLVAYVGFTSEKSADLRAARVAAEAIGCELREVKIPAPSSADLAHVVEAIELPLKAQIEVGWPCLVLAQRIREDGFKVVFSGEGADELLGSYGKAWWGIQTHGWYGWRRRQFLTQHRKNFPRANKAFMTRGVECRLPFLHPPLVDLIWSLTPEAVRGGPLEVNRAVRFRKAVLQEAFRDVLPEKIVDRSKMPFQSGLDIRPMDRPINEDPTRFYNQEYAKHYATTDYRGGAVSHREPSSADHWEVRGEAGGVQRTLWP